MNAEGPNLGNAAEFSTNDNECSTKKQSKSYDFYLLSAANYLSYIPLTKTCWFILQSTLR